MRVRSMPAFAAAVMMLSFCATAAAAAPPSRRVHLLDATVANQVPIGPYELDYSLTQDQSRVQLTFTWPGVGWAAVGWGPYHPTGNGMNGVNMIALAVDRTGAVTCTTLLSETLPYRDPVQDCTVVSQSVNASVPLAVVTITRPLRSNNRRDQMLASGQVYLSWGVCDSTDITKPHAAQGIVPLMFPYCPNDCSQHGTCQNGQCLCDDGYLAADCSLAGALQTNMESHWPGPINVSLAVSPDRTSLHMGLKYSAIGWVGVGWAAPNTEGQMNVTILTVLLDEHTSAPVCQVRFTPEVGTNIWPDFDAVQDCQVTSLTTSGTWTVINVKRTLRADNPSVDRQMITAGPPVPFPWAVGPNQTFLFDIVDDGVMMMQVNPVSNSAAPRTVSSLLMAVLSLLCAVALRR